MKQSLQEFKFKVTFTHHDPMATCRSSTNQTMLFTIKDHYEFLAYDKLHAKLFSDLKFDDVTFKIESLN